MNFELNLPFQHNRPILRVCLLVKFGFESKLKLNHDFHFSLQLSSTATEQAEQSSEYFILLTRLLSYAAASNLSLSTAESLLNTEITWLKKIRENVRKTGSAGCHENLLEGKFTFSNHRWRFCLIQIF